ncbi:Gfo/Idh/MocA family protein [Streptomyces wuyuanensis]|uniref:Predicted dehydrogenase n=1 Tax=Streptomyces wuyuanensis TaxID=1196353 RepID=A0A1H0AGZ3_9ACTN|nr:Gfo/Idh/MocA family oxidoreductase [Streptomyces wuyuanensis]SDN32705.1 Predicted dehydrogenase [Streptomyces wuyuanensis]
MTKPRIGLIGTGPWAERTQAPALAAHPEAVLSGVWGRRPEAAAALAGAHGVTAYEEVDALIEASDAVAFALPPDVQAPLAARAAAAGRHLLLDKPVATTVAGARDVVAAVEGSGVASVVFCTLRFAADTAPWIAEQATAGGWLTGRAHWLGSLFGHGSASPYAASPWRREKGGLWDVGPHALSVLLPVLGDVTDLTALRGQADTVHLAFRHASGASSTATVGLSAPPEAAGASIDLYGERGRVAMPAWSDAVGSFGSAVDALLDSARTGDPHACDVRLGLRITEILAQAEERLGESRAEADGS